MDAARRRVLGLAAGAAASAGFARGAWADAYPSRPVRFVVGYAPGGANDILARLMGQWLSERLGQQFVIENRTGAGSNIATESVAHAAPDGYTLLLVSGSNAINASLYSKLNYDFVRDIAPVAGVAGTSNIMLVNPSLPVATAADFIAYAKRNPGKISMGSPGIGSPQHLSGELLKMMAGIDMLHVPYRGGSPAMTGLLGGECQVVFVTTPSGAEFVKSGQLRALAVTSVTRSDVLPDVRPMAETVPGYEANAWYGVGVPKATPADVIMKLNAEINAGLADPKMEKRFVHLGATALSGTPQEFGKLVAAETEKWAKVVKFAGIKAN